MSERDKKRYDEVKADPVKYAAYLERKRRESKARLGYDGKRKKVWRSKNPELNRMHRMAHRAVEAAVKKGMLRRPTFCQACRNYAKVEAHHHKGYAPEHFLDVIWLCPPCHRKADQGL